VAAARRATPRGENAVVFSVAACTGAGGVCLNVENISGAAACALRKHQRMQLRRILRNLYRRVALGRAQDGGTEQRRRKRRGMGVAVATCVRKITHCAEHQSACLAGGSWRRA